MGSNGSGKSTLALLLAAVLQPASGTVSVMGKDTRLASPFEIRRHIGFVMQNPDDQLVASIVESEVAFGPENLGLPAGECRARVEAALSQVGLAGFEKREVNSLSGGQKQRVAIAGALAMEPDILILDEASSMLDEPSRAHIAELARRLADAGTAVFMITHSEADARAADRVLALKDGRIVIDEAPERAFADGRLQRELGWPTEPFSRNRASLSGPDRPSGGYAARKTEGEIPLVPLVELRDVSFSYASADSAQDELPSFVLENLDLAVHEGELLAITGPTGSGKSTLIQLMNGLLRPSAGTMLVKGKALEGKHAANIARRNAGLVFQYPEHQMFTSSVYDEIAYGPRNLNLPPEEVDARTREALEAVDLPFESFAERNPFALSGGEQRRVAIASVLSMRPAVLILDEPCAGFDPAMHERFLELLCRLNDAGQTIVMVSHEIADVRAVASRTFEL